MNRARGICLMVVLAAVAVLLSFSWWGDQAKSILAAGTPGPGLKIQITSVTIPGDGRPVVEFTLTDGQGNLLSLSDLDANAVRFTIARIDTDPATGLTSYANYIVNTRAGAPFTFGGQTLQPALASATQPAADSGGRFVGKGNGVHTYTFSSALPSDFNKGATHVVGVQSSRGNRAALSNDVFYFVPSGGSPQVRQVVDTSACNQCHNPMKAHGARIDTRYCVTCHTPQNGDPASGLSLDFKVFIHKIHDAGNLASVKAGQPLFVGGENHNFSDVRFPQDVRNCTTCHKNAPQADNWKNAPNAAACTSCHESVNPLTGQGHAGGAQTDATCKNCHTNTQNAEFDLSVPGAHLIPINSTQLRGINFDIVSFTDTKPGQNPTVVYSIKDKAGNTVPPSEMTSLSLVLAGPTYEYQTEPVVSEDARAAASLGDGTFSYTFKASIPGEASGSWAVGIQGYLIQAISGPRGSSVEVRDAGFNRVAYGAVTDAVPQPRKKIVALENCNQCHLAIGSPAGISIHGGSRRNTEFCVLCHNPNHTGGTPPVSVNFDFMIHRIHTGEEGLQSYVIGTHNYNEVRFPGDRRDCQKCHLPQSNLIDFLRGGSQPTIVRQPLTPATTVTGRIVNTTAPVISSTPPISTACSGCHDSASVRAHAALQTAPDGTETCIICHGEGADFAVSEAHAR